ncbi:hypothetical protein [Novosphingobium sp. G106]|uniref:hypothetical protein n=1 Tax=Novosphingobium sp. G106 TaxID=2849500 RepID=UPI0020C2E3EE|nr:hypothetical protein [Novosphingobium sp. G106]
MQLDHFARVTSGDAYRGPRIHDLRHSYAVATLLRWYRAGDDVEQRLPILSTYLGHSHTSCTYWYLGLSRADGACCAAARCPVGAGVMTRSPPIAPLIERYFAQRLMHQRGVSPHTVASYRDTFRLLLCFAQRRLGKPPSDLDLADLDAPFIIAFLDDLEADRAIGT